MIFRWLLDEKNIRKGVQKTSPGISIVCAVLKRLGSTPQIEKWKKSKNSIFPLAPAPPGAPLLLKTVAWIGPRYYFQLPGTEKTPASIRPGYQLPPPPKKIVAASRQRPARPWKKRRRRPTTHHADHCKKNRWASPEGGKCAEDKKQVSLPMGASLYRGNGRLGYSNETWGPNMSLRRSSSCTRRRSSSCARR